MQKTAQKRTGGGWHLQKSCKSIRHHSICYSRMIPCEIHIKDTGVANMWDMYWINYLPRGYKDTLGFILELQTRQSVTHTVSDMLHGTIRKSYFPVWADKSTAELNLSNGQGLRMSMEYYTAALLKTNRNGILIRKGNIVLFMSSVSMFEFPQAGRPSNSLFI